MLKIAYLLLPADLKTHLPLNLHLGIGMGEHFVLYFFSYLIPF